MKPIDLSGLIKGLMVVIGIAMALGKLNDLKSWAIREAFGSKNRIAIGQRVNYLRAHDEAEHRHK